MQCCWLWYLLYCFWICMCWAVECTPYRCFCDSGCRRIGDCCDDIDITCPCEIWSYHLDFFTEQFILIIGITIMYRIQYSYVYFYTVDCGELRNPTNGQVDISNGTILGSTVTYNCSTGYTLLTATAPGLVVVKESGVGHDQLVKVCQSLNLHDTSTKLFV